MVSICFIFLSQEKISWFYNEVRLVIAQVLRWDPWAEIDLRSVYNEMIHTQSDTQMCINTQWGAGGGAELCVCWRSFMGACMCDFISMQYPLQHFEFYKLVLLWLAVKECCGLFVCILSPSLSHFISHSISWVISYISVSCHSCSLPHLPLTHLLFLLLSFTVPGFCHSLSLSLSLSLFLSSLHYTIVSFQCHLHLK